jgi:hypothetical protein
MWGYGGGARVVRSARHCLVWTARIRPSNHLPAGDLGWSSFSFNCSKVAPAPYCWLRGLNHSRRLGLLGVLVLGNSESINPTRPGSLSRPQGGREVHPYTVSSCWHVNKSVEVLHVAILIAGDRGRSATA